MKNQRLLIFSCILSAVLLIVFGFLKTIESPFLNLDVKWLIISIIPILIAILFSGIIHRLKAFGLEYEGRLEVTVNPTKKNLNDENNLKFILNDDAKNNTIPADYIYINHTSFLRPKKQQYFKSLTNVNIDHFDIRVIVDSYYEGALARIEYVVYYLHVSYPHPIQTRTEREDKFLLKEIANGEYVLLAKVFIKDIDKPIILQRYITLNTTGPTIN